MPQFKLDGKRRRLLQTALVTGFSDFTLIQLLKYNNLPTTRIATGADFEARVSSLIDVATEEGWLIKLCEAVAAEPDVRNDVRDDILSVQHWLERDPRSLTVVFSCLGTDNAWVQHFQRHLVGALQPCDSISTLARITQSKDNAPSIFRDIEDANIFVAFISRRYTDNPQTVAELLRGLKSLRGSAVEVEPRRTMLAVALDRDGRDWLHRKMAEIRTLDTERVIVSGFFDDTGRKPIASGTDLSDYIAPEIVNLGEKLRGYFDDPWKPEPVGKLPSPDLGEKVQDPPGIKVDRNPPRAANSIIVLGEPRNPSADDAVAATAELIKELSALKLPYDHWKDGWRKGIKPLDLLKSQPLFVRTIVDTKAASASNLLGRLSSELNVSFGFQFDDEGDKVRAVTDRPKVLWRPSGPDWTPALDGPLLFSNTDRPAEFAQWLAQQLGIDVPTSKAIVLYEDPANKGDTENSCRRLAVEESLRAAIGAGEPPIMPDSAPFGYEQMQEVINSIGKEPNKLTVIAVHDMRTKVDDQDDTLGHFRVIDSQIEDSLSRNHAGNAPLMRVAVLFRNWRLFPTLEFSSNSRVNKWQLLRIKKADDGSLVPDAANLERLRDYATKLRM
ncbi:hypothetical protein HNR60_002809 [Rhodopseudomonas rhenobacensis]|uniref:Effector-associated domain-containing protein n=1 Tax=Rhodopseudomonas rhenobacensis TaxID=87461 RepID=A0A7W8DZI0_9BRAD|nr:effector-associated domain EAD1-containing protein [Rhodopseudomonas rhenobacensis]MBB5048048.1 hypothetical protein [Rhodopseudomonas rhenobacensis]